MSDTAARTATIRPLLPQWAWLLLPLAAALLLMPALAVASEEEQDASYIGIASGASRLPAAGPSYTSRMSRGGLRHVTANFRSLAGDPLSLSFPLSSEDSRESIEEFGVSAAELDALMQACRQRSDCNQQEFDRHTARYYQEHALRLTQRTGQAARLQVDVARVVHRNRARVQPVAAALRRLAAERGEGREWMVEAAIALVQDGLRYRQPGTWEGGRKILGFYPPPHALERGYGDCDTKSALLAAILQNLSDTPLVGVHVPQHYLLGIAGIPRKDQAYIVYRGKPFVLVEAAGPARRPPGEVAPTTLAALEKQDGVRVDPMF